MGRGNRETRGSKSPDERARVEALASSVQPKRFPTTPDAPGRHPGSRGPGASLKPPTNAEGSDDIDIG